MSLIPAFEIGIWNLWILQLFVLLTPYIPYLFLSKEGRKRNGRTTKAFPMPSKTVKVLAWSTHLVIAPIVIIYSIFLPLKLGTPWLYVGIFIVALGLTMQCMTTISVANTPLDKPITRGPFRISRHPFYFTGFLTMFGMGIASASWVVLLCAFLWIAFFYIVVPTEERFLLEKYGDSYRKYIDRTPRWIGIPKPEAK
jgi:protein-S-isoprenylcysteine O-methyltransferase Ste14